MGSRLALVAILLVAAGCSSDADHATRNGSATEPRGRVDRCIERFLERGHGPATAKARRYVEATYCKPFERRGWVHDNGTLRIDAYLHVASGGTCGTAEPGEPTRTVPCEELERTDVAPMLDCALLHLVPRSEVRKYIEALEQRERVTCDDGTPLDELGAEEA